MSADVGAFVAHDGHVGGNLVVGYHDITPRLLREGHGHFAQCGLPGGGGEDVVVIEVGSEVSGTQLRIQFLNRLGLHGGLGRLAALYVEACGDVVGKFHSIHISKRIRILLADVDLPEGTGKHYWFGVCPILFAYRVAGVESVEGGTWCYSTETGSFAIQG